MTGESENNYKSGNQILEKYEKTWAILDTYINIFDIMKVTHISKAKEDIATLL